MQRYELELHYQVDKYCVGAQNMIPQSVVLCHVEYRTKGDWKASEARSL